MYNIVLYMDSNCVLNASTGVVYEPPRETILAAGDRIKVELNPDVWKVMQEGHGGWNDLMSVVCLNCLAN